MLLALLAQIPDYTPTDGKTWIAVGVAIAVGILAFAFLGLKMWLAATRPPAINDVPTPTLDRLNQRALSHMVEETAEEAEAEMAEKQNESAPEDLLAVVPPEEDVSPKSEDKKA